MHSKIYQVSNSPLNGERSYFNDDYLNEYDQYAIGADYFSTLDRDECKRWLSDYPLYPTLFSRDTTQIFENGCDVFIYNGNAPAVLDAWARELTDLIAKFTSDKNDSRALYHIKRKCEYLYGDHDRFYWDNTCELLDSVSFCQLLTNMKEGDKIYVGGIIDFHW